MVVQINFFSLIKILFSTSGQRLKEVFTRLSRFSYGYGLPIFLTLSFLKVYLNIFRFLFLPDTEVTLVLKVKFIQNEFSVANFKCKSQTVRNSERRKYLSIKRELVEYPMFPSVDPWYTPFLWEITVERSRLLGQDVSRYPEPRWRNRRSISSSLVFDESQTQ